MARGNQRDESRAKSDKKRAADLKSQGSTGNPLARNEADKIALDAKKARKLEEARIAAEQEVYEKERIAAGGVAAAAPVKPKVKKVMSSGLDDLLSAGLTGNKKKK
jgi:hypothetical protein